MASFYLQPQADNESIIRNIGRHIRSLGSEKKWCVEVKESTRSLEQNAYYWGVALKTIKEWYHESRGIMVTEDALHEELKPLYVPYKKQQGAYGEQLIFKSTGNLTVSEFRDMTDRMIADFCNMGCFIPPPDKFWKEKK